MSVNKSIEDFIGQLGIISENKNELYSILIPIILSKKFLKNSNEKKQFIENVLEFSIADYAYKSKTILIGKIINNIEQLEIEGIFELNKKLASFISDVIKADNIINNNESKIKLNNKKESFFSNWNNYINHSPELESSFMLKK